MNKGWIKLHRKIMDSEGYLHEPFCRTMAWVDLLMLANHAPNYFRNKGRRVEVERGQLGWSQVALAVRWQWSRGKVDRFLSELENDGKIAQQKNFTTSLITILNYELYQGDDTADEQQTGQQTDTNKNVKNGKNVKNRVNTKAKKEKLLPDEVIKPAGWNEAWDKLWHGYEQYRKAEKKGWYRSPITEQHAITDFWKNSSGDIEVAKAMLEKTISSRWTGIFPILNNNQNGQSKIGGHNRKSGSGDKTTGTLFNIGTADEF